MIVYKFWSTTKYESIYCVTRNWEGWFLLGFIPLFVRLTKYNKRIL